jgi:HSP20 family molecular chaperone IbpA
MTTLVRWDPFREAAAVHNELSRLMNGLFEGNGGTTQTWVPTLDAWETDDALVYAFDLPGVPQDKISVEVEDGTLTVSAERDRSTEISQERYHRFERRFGSGAHRRPSTGRDRGRDQGQLQGGCARDHRPEARAGEAEEDRDRRCRRTDDRRHGHTVLIHPKASLVDADEKAARLGRAGLRSCSHITPGAAPRPPLL